MFEECEIQGQELQTVLINYKLFQCVEPLFSAFPVLRQTTIRDENFGSDISISFVQVKTHISSTFSPTWTHIPHEAKPTAHVTRLCSDSAAGWLCLRQESKRTGQGSSWERQIPGDKSG